MKQTNKKNLNIFCRFFYWSWNYLFRVSKCHWHPLVFCYSVFVFVLTAAIPGAVRLCTGPQHGQCPQAAGRVTVGMALWGLQPPSSSGMAPGKIPSRHTPASIPNLSPKPVQHPCLCDGPHGRRWHPGTGLSHCNVPGHGLG